ncbi:hypothetical protein LEMLEM_LOCUS3833 [Lemmus lemmus]
MSVQHPHCSYSLQANVRASQVTVGHTAVSVRKTLTALRLEDAFLPQKLLAPAAAATKIQQRRILGSRKLPRQFLRRPPSKQHVSCPAEKEKKQMLRLEETLNRLPQVQITQGQANSTITQLAVKIMNIKKNVLQEFYLL